MLYKKILLSILLLAGVPLASAQSMDEQEALNGLDMAAVARVVHMNSQSLPDGVAFRGILNLLKIYNDIDPSMAVQVIIQDTGWDEIKSQLFLPQALETYEVLLASSLAARSQIACSYMAVADYSKNAGYEALHLMDDTHDDISEQYYWETKATMDRITETKFEKWISNQKQNTVQVKFDYKKADKETGSDSTQLLQGICDVSKGR